MSTAGSAAHPSGNKVHLSLDVEYFGAIIGRHYPATVTLTVEMTAPNEWSVSTLAFRDHVNSIPPNKQNLALLRRQLNKLLAD